MLDPDLIVLAPDRPDVALVVEVKAGPVDLPELEKSIKQYMLLRHCGLALVVTPEQSWLYRDTFKGFGEESIETVGQYSTAEFFNITDLPVQNGLALERVVREWLSQLASHWPRALPAEESIRKAVVEYLVPAVTEGRVLSGRLAT